MTASAETPTCQICGKPRGACYLICDECLPAWEAAQQWAEWNEYVDMTLLSGETRCWTCQRPTRFNPCRTCDGLDQDENEGRYA